MNELINLKQYPVEGNLKYLLQDKTTRQNIIFATDSYSSFGESFGAKRHMTLTEVVGLNSCEIQPRILKAQDEQAERTKKKAEVFTPAWLCCMMNNHCDEEWFGRKDVFNHLDGTEWTVIEDKVEFPKGRKWQSYVDSRRLEITCGEAPYIVSRYDASTGEMILPPKRRIGILDRKLRIVNENTETEQDWLKWTERAFQSVYGYEFQGDSLLIARINLLQTFSDYLENRWNRQATSKELARISNIIAWNFWQMDGLKGTVPYGEQVEKEKALHQMNFLDMGWETDPSDTEQTTPSDTASMECKVFDWRSKQSVLYSSLKKR